MMDGMRKKKKKSDRKKSGKKKVKMINGMESNDN